MDSSIFKEKLTLFENNQTIPVIIRKTGYLDKAEWIYSMSHVDYIRNLIDQKINLRPDRIRLIKLLLDMYISKEIGIPTVHAGLIFIYGPTLTLSYDSIMTNEITEKKIGRKRIEVLAKIPEIRILSDGDYITYQYQQIYASKSVTPRLDGIRIMFDPNKFDEQFGVVYPSDEIKWIEPIPGELELKSRLWVSDNEEK